MDKCDTEFVVVIKPLEACQAMWQRKSRVRGAAFGLIDASGAKIPLFSSNTRIQSRE